MQGVSGDETERGTFSLLPRPRFSPLTTRILLFNAFALLVLIGGVLWIQSSRVGLVDERIDGIREQALIVAGALAEYTTDAGEPTMNIAVAEPLLRQLIAPTKLRARIYGPNGKLLLDTRNLLARNVVTTVQLPPPLSSNGFTAFLQRAWSEITRIYDAVMGVRPLTKLAPYFEAATDGRVYSEVNDALGGQTASNIRVSEQDKLVLSVAVPVKRFAALYGALMLTTESGDIDSILRDERSALLKVFLVAFGTLLLSSLYLARFIAMPIRRLAAAAERVRRHGEGHEQIPTLGDREDEIGELADSLSSMTNALYERIDAIERFAADVAHELKNPLTSLQSAIDMLARTEKPEDRDRLMALLRNDIQRLDRLITDISDASRLDAELSREASAPLDLSRLLETLAGIYRDVGLPRGIVLALDVKLPRPAIVHGIDERLGEVFRNLIDNAISFSPDGGTVTARIRRSGSIVIVSIEDDGPGIPEENLESIFDRFYTERPTEQGFGKNSGLGLSIARQIVKSHDGRIWAENRRDEKGAAIGARFLVRLPLMRDDA
jgi:two-component system sensor histidine kinase ChvG